MKFNEDMIERIELLLEDICADYKRWCGLKDGDDDLSTDRVKEFGESLHYEVGQKYVRILQENRVWGFVVASEKDQKFSQGEILKAASYKTPTRNAGRGNLFTEYTIEWTGPQYL
jgi:hypothetical protein